MEDMGTDIMTIPMGFIPMAATTITVMIVLMETITTGMIAIMIQTAAPIVDSELGEGEKARQETASFDLRGN